MMDNLKESKTKYILQIYVFEKFSPDILSSEIKKIVSRYYGILDFVGGGGSRGSFYGVYRASFPKKIVNEKELTNIITNVYSIKSKIEEVKITNVCKYNVSRECFVSEDKK